MQKCLEDSFARCPEQMPSGRILPLGTACSMPCLQCLAGHAPLQPKGCRSSSAQPLYRWAASAGFPGLASLYNALLDTLDPLNPGLLFLLEGGLHFRAQAQDLVGAHIRIWTGFQRLKPECLVDVSPLSALSDEWTVICDTSAPEHCRPSIWQLLKCRTYIGPHASSGRYCRPPLPLSSQAHHGACPHGSSCSC